MVDRRSRSPHNENRFADRFSRQKKEDEYWKKRRERRERYAARGADDVWARSPSHSDLRRLREEHKKAEKKAAEEARQFEKLERKRLKRFKKDQKRALKKAKKEQKRKMKETKEAEERKHRDSYFDLSANDSKKALHGEAAGMSAYIAEGKRIPRRGEIGLNSDEIAEFEKAGYIMSGTRHKSMEAVRLQKENLAYTAEEKRLLGKFTQEQRKQKEEAIMSQFKSLVAAKRGGL